MLCLQDLQESVPTTLPLNEERVLALEQLYPKLLHEVVRPHWLNAKPYEKELYLLVCPGCWASDRGDAGEGSSAGRDKKRGDQEARDPGSSNEDTENEDDEELAAAVAASIQQTHEDDSVDEAMLALAIEASLAAEEGAVAEKGNTGHERAWSGRATEPQGQGLLENPKSSAVNLT